MRMFYPRKKWKIKGDIKSNNIWRLLKSKCLQNVWKRCKLNIIYVRGFTSQIKGFVNTCSSWVTITITKTIAPFPPRSKISVINPVKTTELKNKYKMGKRGKNFKKSNRKHPSDEETPAEDERLSRDLKHIGAAFIHPLQHLRHSPNRQRRSPNRRVLVPETPASPNQSQAVSTSADSTAAVNETPRLF